MFFSLAGRHGENKSRALKIENFDLHGLADGRSLRKSKNCVGLKGDWQLVTLTRLFLSSKNKKKKTLMNPWFMLQSRLNHRLYQMRAPRRLRITKFQSIHLLTRNRLLTL